MSDEECPNVTDIDLAPTKESTSSQTSPDADTLQKSRRTLLASRPPSCHLTRVDEEPTTTTKSRETEIETVDRGVGPTPHPPNVDTRDPRDLRDPRFPPSYFGFPPLIDPRNGLFESPYSGFNLPYQLPYPVNAPIPLNSGTLEGRYNWPPPSPYHHPIHGLATSPSHSDVSLFSMRSQLSPGEPVTNLAARIHLEQLQRSYYQPGHLGQRRYSPASLPDYNRYRQALLDQEYSRLSQTIGHQGYPSVPGSLYGDYPPSHASQSGRSIFGDIPPTPGSGSITLPGSVESSRLTSPRPSIIGKSSRKRALSHSPISDYLDIQSLTRSSEGSLHLTPYMHQNNSRSSSASGSYGHLSAASLGTASPAHQQHPHNPQPT
ncbi:unnamed protein product [Mytilus coruscus]|uniref:Uncharacterized protein n=1 Tax=Mytilus coruscus TaxID=42192 RepID=A0A6J8DSE2_MYTCO|nr:unnamed protein product [Mytilus coruscus]